MRTVAGILLLVMGIIFPMGMLAWLNSRFNRQPRPTPRQVGLLLAFNGILPAGLVLLGLGLMSPGLWAVTWLRAAALAAWLGAGIVLIALVVAGRTKPAGGRDG